MRERVERSKASRWELSLLVALLCCVGAVGCKKKTVEKSDAPALIQVLRVESPSAESPGAEHCPSADKPCQPLAAQQKIAPTGTVRTFAGGRVSLDFGAGRRLDLDSLSQVDLSRESARLVEGEFSVDTVPLIQKENIAPLVLEASGKKLAGVSDVPTSAAFAVHDNQTLLTVHRGTLEGVQVDGQAPRAGQSIRLTNARAFQTTEYGGELPAIAPFAPRRKDYEGLLPETTRARRGLGTMSARLPNTEQRRDGVVLKKHHVRVTIRDGYARTEVEEEFENRTAQILEGRYVFPIPGDASVSRLGLWVGDTLMEGEVVERKRARQIYESIVDRPVPRDPALLEWVSGGKLSLTVFPILPQKTRKLVLAYNQALSTEGGVLRYVYPLSLGPGRENLINDFSLTVQLSDSQAELGRILVSGYDVEQGYEGSVATISLSEKNFSPSRDFAVSVLRKPRQRAELAVSPDEGLFALRTKVELPEGMARPAYQRVDRAIVLDVSHSQSQESIHAQGALALSMVRELSKEESFVLLACDSACQAHQGSVDMRLSARIETSKKWLSELRPGGSSDLAGAIVSATAHLNRLRDPNLGHQRQLVVLSDGNVSSGELSADAIGGRVRPHLMGSGVDLRLVGAGRTVFQDLLTNLAAKLGAPVDFLQGDHSLEARLFELTIGLRKPVISNVRFQLPAGLLASRQYEPRAFRLGQEVILTGRLTPEEPPLGPQELRVTGDLGGRPYLLSQNIDRRAASSPTNPLVVRLWARDRIAALSSLPQSESTTREIVALSTKYRTLSPRTSFLVLENEQMYSDFGVKRTSESVRDQVDAKFSLFDDSLRAQDGEGHTLQSLGTGPSNVGSSQLARPMSASRSASSGAARKMERATAPQPRPKASPKPRPSPRPQATRASPSASSADPMLDLSEGAPPAEAEERVFPSQLAPILQRYRFPHLEIRRANDAWRQWGKSRANEQLAKVENGPESRKAYETAIIELLALGRFQAARNLAERFFESDPDNPRAAGLLAFAAVVGGDHELSRKMLDVIVEASPRDEELHVQAARAFLAVGDEVRACAHLRSAAFLQPTSAASKTASTCWARLTDDQVATPGFEAPPGSSGPLQVEVVCSEGVAPSSCPSPVVVTPSGKILSPWTPGAGETHRQLITSPKVTSGTYRVLVAAGAPGSSGRVIVRGRHTQESLSFQGGALHTVAEVQVRWN